MGLKKKENRRYAKFDDEGTETIDRSLQPTSRGIARLLLY